MQRDVTRRWSSARFSCHLYTDNYFAGHHRRDFRSIFIQTELPRRWSSARFFMPSLYRQNYLEADHRRDFRAISIPTQLPRWSSARRSCLLHKEELPGTDHGRHFCAFFIKKNYLATDHWRDFRALFIQTEVPRRWSLAGFSYFLYTDRSTSSLIIGEISVPSLYK